MLGQLHPGQRFMLCRTREFYRTTGMWQGENRYRIVVVDDRGRVTSLNYQCYVKPCEVAA